MITALLVLATISSTVAIVASIIGLQIARDRDAGNVLLEDTLASEIRWRGRAERAEAYYRAHRDCRRESRAARRRDEHAPRMPRPEPLASTSAPAEAQPLPLVSASVPAAPIGASCGDRLGGELDGGGE